MERTMSVEEKIRRAEEIYNRKKERQYKVTNTRVSVENSNKATSSINQKLKKMIIQIVVCMIIYLIFYYVINNNYIFSDDFKSKCEEILSYDISFSQMYESMQKTFEWIGQKYQGIFQDSNPNKQENVEQNDEENKQENEQETNQEVQEQNGEEQNSEEQNVEEQNKQNDLIQNNEEGSQDTGDQNIGGAEVTENVLAISQENLTEEEQMQKDAEEIKSKINFIKPLQGTITSVFGWRNPTVKTVSKYHTGIDIATKEGTDIISATNGKVGLASSVGAYGNHLKIETEGIIVLYAHCSSLLVNEGDEISQGQVIAKVGTTGNSTGPHLHFEIRKDDRYVDPKLILDF